MEKIYGNKLQSLLQHLHIWGVAKREEDRVENPVVVIKAENLAVNVENQEKKEKEELAVEEDDNLG